MSPARLKARALALLDSEAPSTEANSTEILEMVNEKR